MCNHDCAFFYFGTKQMQGIRINVKMKIAYDTFEHAKRGICDMTNRQICY